MVTASDPRLIPTRRALHGVAELVLAGPQHAQTGEISLRSVPGGFATTHTPDLRVVGTEVVGRHHDGGHQRPHPGHAGRRPSASRRPRCPRLYSRRCGSRPRRRARGRRRRSRPGRRRLRGRRRRAARPGSRARHRSCGPSTSTSASPSARSTTASPPATPTSRSPTPTSGPWSPPAQDDFWNAPFGRAVPVEDIPDLLAFFTEGRDRSSVEEGRQARHETPRRRTSEPVDSRRS